MAMIPDADQLDLLAQLPRTPASDVKRLGWKSLMKAIRSGGRLVVTNHNEPEAVILSAEEYANLMRLAQQTTMNTEATLANLRHSFDQRLAALQTPDAGDRLRSVMREAARLEGKVKAGDGH